MAYLRKKDSNPSHQNLIVEFLDLDTSKITLTKPYPNPYGGSFAYLNYKDSPHTIYIKINDQYYPLMVLTHDDE